MIKILHTGDLHLGREYKRQEQENKFIAEQYRKARLEALKNIVRLANRENCDYLVIAGDFYDRRNITASLHKEVCEILSEYDAGIILILPGNHDYYEGEEDRLWSSFLGRAGENIILAREKKRIEMDKVIFYPCPCQDKYSKNNALAWLKADKRREDSKINIGIGHGAIEGLSFDREKQYYYMTEKELEQCDMDVWLIGHTHIPYPNQEIILNHAVFNAGTHQQTDLADDAEGSAFLIQIDGEKNIIAKKIHTGVIWFRKKQIEIKHGEHLREKIDQAIQGIDRKHTTLRLSISGVALEEEYEEKERIYLEYEESFLKFEVLDGELRREITKKRIEQETIEGSVENQLLKQYLDQPELLNLAFSFIQKCKEGDKDED